MLRAFAKRHPLEYDLEDWASFISDHIARGLDIYSDLHSYFDTSSTLTAILRYTAYSDVAVGNLHLWLDVLELAGVDIAQYLEIETPRCFATWEASATYHMPRRRRKGSLINRVLQQQHSKGRLIHYWREEIDSTCPIQELLIEFPRFLHPETTETRADATETTWLRRALEDREDTGLIEPEKISWPVAPQMEDDQRSGDPKLVKGVSPEYIQAMERVYRGYYQRKKRRERKLEQKMLRGSGKKKPQGKMPLPGSWVD